ncbi:MAG TPA: hypothetical protein VMJ90_00815 [Anaerolineales bacterium]|nr:hypothetical protein [Anaerolineales bacterium]
MKSRILPFGLILSLLLAACGAEQPTLSSVDVAGTAQAAAFTMVAETQQALPTDTPLPPTNTPTATPLPTDTPTSTPTIDPLLPTATFTRDPNASATSQGNCDKVLAEWQVPTIRILVKNETQPRGTIILGLYVETALGECGYIPVYGNSASGPAGYYSAFAWVTGRRNFQVSGGFLLNGGSWSLVVRNETIVAKGGCYPNC